MTAPATSGSSKKVRDLAVRDFVAPSSRRRKSEFSIPVRSLLQALKQEGFPAGNTPQVCSAIQSKKFLAQNHLVIDRIDGPPSGQSTTVVVHYRFTQRQDDTVAEATAEKRAIALIRESAGLLQPTIEKFGGPEALLQWIRSETTS